MFLSYTEENIALKYYCCNHPLGAIVIMIVL